MSDRFITSRRKLLQSGFGVSAGLMLGAADSAQAQARKLDKLDLDSPTGGLNAYVKLLGTLEQSNVYIAFSGTLWGILPERVPTAICGFSGLARHQWTPRKEGHHRKSFDVGYFSDLATGEPADEIVNPLTGETVHPFHYKYGGGEQLYTKQGLMAVSGEGEASTLKPYELNWESAGEQVWLTEGGGGEFPSPLPKEEWPRESSGDAYRVVGETTLVSTIDQLASRRVAQADYTLFWTSILSWEPWLLMDGRPGFAMWRGVGAKLTQPDDAPETLLDYVLEEQPNYFGKDDPWEGVLSNYDRFKEMRTPAG